MARIEQAPSVVFPLPMHLNEKDQPLLCAAVRAQCEYFVTDDRRDFGHLYDHAVEGVTVISLLRLAELMVADL